MLLRCEALEPPLSLVGHERPARREQMLSALLLIPALERTFENRRSVP
jgi:hypothetical protein